MDRGYETKFGSERPIGSKKWIQRVAGLLVLTAYLTLHCMSCLLTHC